MKGVTSMSCSKVAYPSPQKAKSAIDRIRADRIRRAKRRGASRHMKSPARYYKCVECGMWHITSNPRGDD